jgi:ADP-ribose pyrophosphatase YjhB (NUDIX family)
MNREYPRAPLVGVGALIIAEEKILLAQRGRAPGKGQWSIPGGLVEVGEPLLEATKREVLEETGLVVAPVGLVELLERIFHDERGRVKYHYILADYLCHPVSGISKAGSDATDLVWAGKDELEAYELPEVTRKAINRAFELEESLRRAM